MRRITVAIPLFLALSWTWLLPAEEAKTAKNTGSFEVEAIKDLAYYDAADADPVKHKLDLYLPKGKKDFPVIFFVHGGGWMSGDKKYLFDVYGKVGQNFARHGIGTVVTNYRLTPQVQHPAHIQDVAKAFAWTRKNIAKHGGRPDQIFIAGHSAGGHLVALLATDPQYLEAEKCSFKDIKGAMPLSGVYNLPPGKLFENVFTSDSKTREQAMPLTHVKGQHPPFLIIHAESDFPFCDRMSKEFCDKLTRCKCEACVAEIKKRDHLSIIARAANDDDPAVQLMLDFVSKHTATK
jgi:alpha-beta hydrolase superfamily lysophospholipase